MKKTREFEMYLEDVNIEGFKSFSEKTNMSFQPGIGVIIGNNGVGKSNILDAIVWALGENNIERIRCYEQEELFFSGSKKYPPATTIRIELTLKENQDKDAPATQLVREMTKTGQNRFWINDTSVDAEAYLVKLKQLRLKQSLKTIIRQEQINDFLQQSPPRRFQSIQSLLEIESTDEVIDCLDRTVAPLLQRYMRYLIPLAEVELKTPSQNGQIGFEIVVTLPGNRVRRVHQLSGGEKSITSLALKLALFTQLESFFYLMDEVEPSLDYTNHKSMQAFLKDVAADKQLIMITHLRSTIDLAETLHGVRTRFDGSSFMKFYFLMNERLLRMYKCC